MNSVAAEHPVRARLGAWPYEPDVAHLVLLDHHMEPAAHHVADWVAQARALGARAVRTGALFPPSTPAFTAAGFRTIDSLRLLELNLNRQPPHRYQPARLLARQPADRSPTPKLRRLAPSMLDQAATLDQLAFSPPWANSPAALADIIAATPHSRARYIDIDGQMVAFSISGRASQWGYVQRLAVHPDRRRRGLAGHLLADALRWMHRRTVRQVLVNTGTDNAAALALYRAHGFADQPDDLLILERTLEHAGAHPDEEQ